MQFSSQLLLERLDALAAGRDVARWIVSYSGGIDSSVLLHALATSGTTDPVIAVYVDHGLHPDSARWGDHCESFALGLGAGFERLTVDVDDYAGSGPEAAARQARYAALIGVVADGDCLLSGHHEDDQAETLLLNLMRGSGPAGLAGIGASQSFGRGRLLRPMLGVPGDAIADYAESHGVQWLDDPSNVDTRFDRNFLRNDIIPALAARWPAVSNRMRRSAELLGEASDLLDQLADIDLRHCGPLEALSVSAIGELPPARQRNLLRRAARRNGLPPPPYTRLHQLQHELIPAREDAAPLVRWPGAEARRYQGRVYLLPDLQSAPDVPGDRLRPDGVPVSLGTGLGSIVLTQSAPGIDPAIASEGLEIRFRAGGEEIRIQEGGPTRKLKKLMQESAVLPWMRDRLPILYSGSEVVAVGDLWISAVHTADHGFAVEWRRKPAIRPPAAL